MTETSQKALGIPHPQGSWTLITRPIPPPGPGDALVKIEGIGLNPAEWIIPKLPIEVSKVFIREYPALIGASDLITFFISKRLTTTLSL